MALETLKGKKEIHGEKIVIMDELKEQYPEHFNAETGQMNYKWFEKEIRPNRFIMVRNDVNSLTFTLQNGPIKEVGKNGCQVDHIIAVAKTIIEEFNKNCPCPKNSFAIHHLNNALFYLGRRTKDREARNVEGTSRE